MGGRYVVNVHLVTSRLCVGWLCKCIWITSWKFIKIKLGVGLGDYIAPETFCVYCKLSEYHYGLIQKKLWQVARRWLMAQGERPLLTMPSRVKIKSTPAVGPTTPQSARYISGNPINVVQYTWFGFFHGLAIIGCCSLARWRGLCAALCYYVVCHISTCYLSCFPASSFPPRVCKAFGK